MNLNISLFAASMLAVLGGAAAHAGTFEDVLEDQIDRLRTYVLDAIEPNGLVRDSLPLSPSVGPFHPATPDAAGFAIIALCALDHLNAIENASELVQLILDAHTGHVPNVTPLRSDAGFFVHNMNVSDGTYVGLPWDDAFTTIGTALLVNASQFARNHFITNAAIALRAEELESSVDFDLAIDPALNGDVFFSVPQKGACGQIFGTTSPWNEFMLVVSLALRQENNERAKAVEHLWRNPADLPTIDYLCEGNRIAMLTDDPTQFGPAFWVQQSHFFNADFATNPEFATYFVNQQLADQCFCLTELAKKYRYGLTAGVIRGGYAADRIGNHHGVFSPEAVMAWGDLQTLMSFVADQPPKSDPKYRYGLVRVSNESAWIPFDAGLVDHLFLLFGIAESIDPLFFLQRLPGQDDDDADGIADTYDNCPNTFNPAQADCDQDGIGDLCDSNPQEGDVNCGGTVDGEDLTQLLNAWGPCAGPPDPCPADLDGDNTVGIVDFLILLGSSWG